MGHNVCLSVSMSFSQTVAANGIKNDSYKYVLYSLCVVRVFCRQRT